MLMFRTPLFNTLNIADYGQPDREVTDANFGQNTSTNTTEQRFHFYSMFCPGEDLKLQSD